MFKFTALLPFAFGLVSGSPAFAQADATAFTGPRAEATVGWVQVQFDLADLGSVGRGHASALRYGGALGYDVAVGPALVAGLELGVNGSDARRRGGGTLASGDLQRRRELEAAVRLGAPITANTLLYGKIGYANLQVRQDLLAAGLTTSRLRDLGGVLLGAGAEVKVSPRVYFKSEYQHANYADAHDGNAVVTGVGLRF